MTLSLDHLQGDPHPMLHRIPLMRYRLHPYLIPFLTIVALNLSPSAILAATRTTTQLHTIYVPAAIHHGFVSVQLRRAFEKLGATVNYSAPPATVHVQRAGRNLLSVLVGSRATLVNGIPHVSEFAPFNPHGRVIIPLALVQGATHGTASYNPQAHKARISELVTVVVSTDHASPAETDIILTPDNKTQAIPWWIWACSAFVVLGLAVLAFAQQRRNIKA